MASPPRIAVDVLRSREDPEAVAQVTADALRRGQASPSEFAAALAPGAAPQGLRRGDGTALLQSPLDLTGDPGSGSWVSRAHVHEQATS